MGSLRSLLDWMFPDIAPDLTYDETVERQARRRIAASKFLQDVEKRMRELQNAEREANNETLK
jgi:hypothetical protein